MIRLKSGPRANIIVGPANNRYVGIEGAYVNLLNHYCTHAKEKLADGNATTLTIQGSKQNIVWIYKYMLASEKNPEGLQSFEELDIAELVMMYSICVSLGYQQLMDQIFTRLNHLFKNRLLDVTSIKNIAIHAPSCNKVVANAVARMLIRPLVYNYEAWVAHAANDEGFRDNVEAEVQEMLKKRIEIGKDFYSKSRHNSIVSWSTQYYLDRARARTPIKKQIKRRKPSGPLANSKTKNVVSLNAQPKNDTAVQPKPKRKNNPRCYRCKDRGHVKQDCPDRNKHEAQAAQAAPVTTTPSTQKQEPSATEAPLQAHTPTKADQLIESIKKVIKKTGRPLPVCYACNDEGHIARNCPNPPVAYLEAMKHSHRSDRVLQNATSQYSHVSYGWNKNYRRARAERVNYETAL